MEEVFLFVCVLVVLVIRWIYLRDRLYELENRLSVLERESAKRAYDANRAYIDQLPRQEPAHAPAPTATPPPPHAVERPVPPPEPAPAQPPAPMLPLPDAFQSVAETVHRTSEEWEALIGGNWVNKVGVFVAVIGIALLLNRSEERRVGKECRSRWSPYKVWLHQIGR